MSSDNYHEQVDEQPAEPVFDFDGGQEAKVDEKGRLRLPVKFRQILESNNESSCFVTISTDMNCARIYPRPIWERLRSQFRQMPPKPEKIKAQRLLKMYGDEATLDPQGRLLLPQALRSEVKISGDVRVLGMGEYLEVWNAVVLKSEMTPFTLDEQKELGLDI